MKLLIIKETEKAVAVKNETYASAIETANYDCKELSGYELNALRNETRLMWLPKSCITIEDNFVIDMQEWLAEKNGFKTDRHIENLVRAFYNGCKKYEAVLNFAKSHNLPVRNKMKLQTILNIISNAGLTYQN